MAIGIHHRIGKHGFAPPGRKHAGAGGPLRESPRNCAKAVSSVEELGWVALEIEADGAIGAVVDNEPHWATEGRETAAPSCELVTKTVERLLYKGDGSSRQVEVDAQKYVDADERGDKERFGTTSFGDDDSVGPKFQPSKPPQRTRGDTAGFSRRLL